MLGTSVRDGVGQSLFLLLPLQFSVSFSTIDNDLFWKQQTELRLRIFSHRDFSPFCSDQFKMSFLFNMMESEFSFCVGFLLHT